MSPCNFVDGWLQFSIEFVLQSPVPTEKWHLHVDDFSNCLRFIIHHLRSSRQTVLFEWQSKSFTHLRLSALIICICDLASIPVFPLVMLLMNPISKEISAGLLGTPSHFSHKAWRLKPKQSHLKYTGKFWESAFAERFFHFQLACILNKFKELWLPRCCAA